MHRTDLNLCAAYNNSNTNCTHHFRWSFSSIYLFMDPRLVSDMALNYLPGTQIRIQQVHLTIPEICDNVTITIDEEQNQWERSVLLLNKLTTFVSIIICINFILTGIITLVKKIILVFLWDVINFQLSNSQLHLWKQKDCK